MRRSRRIVIRLLLNEKGSSENATLRAFSDISRWKVDKGCKCQLPSLHWRLAQLESAALKLRLQRFWPSFIAFKRC